MLTVYGDVAAGPPQIEAVSYTHLDVYKRQLHNMPFEVTPETTYAAIMGANAYGHYMLGE